ALSTESRSGVSPPSGIPPDRGKETLGVDGRADRRHFARRAELGQQSGVAAAAGDGVVEARRLDLKHEARIIFEVAAELGGEGRARKVDAALLNALEAANKGGEGRGKVEACVLAERGPALDRFPGRPRNREVGLDHGSDFFPQRSGA